jgi:hypothetical protein
MSYSVAAAWSAAMPEGSAGRSSSITKYRIKLPGNPNTILKNGITEKENRPRTNPSRLRCYPRILLASRLFTGSVMFGGLFNADTSNLRGQRLELNRSAAHIPKTLSAGGHGPIHGYDEYINNNLAEKLSQLSINTPPLAPFDCSIDSALSIPMLTRSQGNTSTSAYALNNTGGRYANGQATGQAGRTNHASRSSQLTPARQNAKGPTRTKYGRKGRRRRRRSLFPMSIKKDLIPGQIRSVASSLVEDNALAYFLENRQVIFAAWTSLSTTMASTSVDESVVAAFDTVRSLIQSKDRKRLDLRFAYVHLNRAINALNTVGEVAYTDTYLNAKNNSSDISSDQLNEYARRGERWSTLAGPSPFLLSVYSRSAETIVYVLLLCNSFNTKCVAKLQ